MKSPKPLALRVSVFADETPDLYAQLLTLLPDQKFRRRTTLLRILEAGCRVEAGELPEPVARVPSNAAVAEKEAAVTLEAMPQQHQPEPPVSGVAEVILDSDELMDLFGAPTA
ncbi:hypothetical protein [Thauera mechernichensis]